MHSCAIRLSSKIAMEQIPSSPEVKVCELSILRLSRLSHVLKDPKVEAWIGYWLTADS